MAHAILICGQDQSTRSPIFSAFKDAFFNVDQASAIDEKTTQIEAGAYELVLCIGSVPTKAQLKICSEANCALLVQSDGASVESSELICDAAGSVASPTVMILRARNLLRTRMMLLELNRRHGQSQTTEIISEQGVRKSLLVVQDPSKIDPDLFHQLANDRDVETVTGGQSAFIRAAQTNFDCMIVPLDDAVCDPRRLVAQLCALPQTRRLPILFIASSQTVQDARSLAERSGNDWVCLPDEMESLELRIGHLLRRKSLQEALHQHARQIARTSSIDSESGFYTETHLRDRLTNMAKSSGETKPLALMALQIDNFDALRATCGQAEAKKTLGKIGSVIRDNMRSLDMACQIDGEMIIVAMPETQIDDAEHVVLRMKAEMAHVEVSTQNGAPTFELSVTIAVACSDGQEQASSALLDKTKSALQEARLNVRDQILMIAA